MTKDINIEETSSELSSQLKYRRYCRSTGVFDHFEHERATVLLDTIWPAWGTVLGNYQICQIGRPALPCTFNDNSKQRHLSDEDSGCGGRAKSEFQISTTEAKSANQQDRRMS